MADVNRGRRPLSPHLTIYRPQITMVMSILHRITGVGLTLAALLIVWWFLAAATGRDAFLTADGVLTSPLGLFVLFASLVAFWYHFWNGIRHLWWDTGRGFALSEVDKTGIVVIVATALSSILTLVFAAY